jgi:hypothetical protein
MRHGTDMTRIQEKRTDEARDRYDKDTGEKNR